MLFDPKKRLKKILDIQIDELSLVDKTATGKNFAITKSAQVLAEKVDKIIYEGEKTKPVLKAIAGRLEEKENAEFSKHLDPLLELRDDLPPDLQGAAEMAVSLALGSAALGPDEESAADLERVKEVFTKYENDMNEELTGALDYFQKIAAEGLEGFDYSELQDPEEDPEDKGPGYVSRYGPDFVAGRRIIEDDAARIEKAKEIQWPSFQIDEKDVGPGSLFGVEYIGKSVFAAGEEEDPEEEDELTDKEKIKKLEAQLAKRKKRQSQQLKEAPEDDDEEGIEKGEDEFIWTSLI